MAIAGTVLIGMAALATQAGAWYLAARNASTAADLAALAGAAALARGQSAISIAADTAARNGFPNGGRSTVTVANPPTSGAYAGNTAAVEVLVTQTQNLGLATGFRAVAPTVSRRAVAISAEDMKACALALGGGIELGGNSVTSGPRCFLGSNATPPTGITVSGNAKVRTAGLITTGSCNNCTGGDVWTDDTKTTRPVVMAGLPNPITDPYAALRNWTPTPPACRTTAIALSGNNNSTASASITASEGTICGGLSIGPHETLTLAAGLYYITGNVSVQGTLTGSGVTLVLTGNVDSVATLQINSQSVTDLRGPTSSLIPGHSEAAGLVIYRDARATNNGNNNAVQLNGGATMKLYGGLYFPTSDVVVNGNSDSTCMSLIAYRMSFSGSGNTKLDVSGCTNFAAYAALGTVRLVE